MDRPNKRPRPKRAATRRSFLTGISALLATTVSRMPVGADDDTKGRAESNERLERMRRLARGVTLSEITKGKVGPPVPLRPDPLLRYGDPGRDIEDGTLWAWGERGRPLAILKVEHWRDGGESSHWAMGVSALSPRRITIQYDDGETWTSRRPGIKLHPFSNASPPMDGIAQRLTQAKGLARRFSARVDTQGESGRIALRLLPKPIDRYTDRDEGLLDGLMFAFAYATNPIAILCLEARMDESGTPAWFYGFARHGVGEATVLLEGKDVWTAPSVASPTDVETYTNRPLPAGAEVK